MSTSFTTYTPSYENILTRMNRLKHNSQTHHRTQTTVSPPMATQPAHVDLSVSKRYNRRVSPTAFNIQEEIANTGKFTGRVTKNVGLKKYNQRQIREVMLNREINRPQNDEKNSPLREEILKIKTENVPSPSKALGVGKLHFASRRGL